ncbi:hypothetical protein OT109_11610 [Phycisphaeraceae bacterium D3-23]
MVALLSLLSIPVSLVSLACWIYTIVVAFKKEEGPLFGILCICPLVGLILGWVKHAEWDHTKVMMVWTACVVINIILNVVVTMASAAA